MWPQLFLQGEDSQIDLVGQYSVCSHVLGLTLPVAGLDTGVGAAGIAHCRVTVDEHLRKGSASPSGNSFTTTSQLYRVLLNIHGVIVHKRKHFKGETFVMVRVLESRGAVHLHHFGQVMVVAVGTPEVRQSWK